MGWETAIAAGASILGGYLGGKGSDSTVEEKSEPWIELQPYLKDLYKLAQDQQRNFQPNFYPQQTFAPMDPMQMAAQRMAMQYVMGPQAQTPGFNTPQMPSQIPSYKPRQGQQQVPPMGIPNIPGF